MKKKKYTDPEFEYVKIMLSSPLCVSGTPEGYKEDGDNEGFGND